MRVPNQKAHQEKISQDVEYLKALVGRPPISFYPIFGQIAGGAGGGVFLSQLVYWSARGSDPDGWIYKSQPEWTEETCILRGEQESARKILIRAGILQEERRGNPCRLFYRLNFEKLAEEVRKRCAPSFSSTEAGGLPHTEAGWLSLLGELTDAAAWDYQSSHKRIVNLKSFARGVASRLEKDIRLHGKPNRLDIDALLLRREFQARLAERKQAADSKTSTEAKPKIRTDLSEQERKKQEDLMKKMSKNFGAHQKQGQGGKA